jgi:UDPglucose 6-dehydrogenase
LKILVIGLGYVGTANAVLLSQQNEVVCYDLNADRINLINDKKSPIEDKVASEYLSEKKLNLRGVSEFPSQDDFDFAIIATPTNYDPDTNHFDTSTVESCIASVNSQNSKATIVIRSTLPVGFVEHVQKNILTKKLYLFLNFYEKAKPCMIVFIHQE